ncbi:MAG: hypothetical protein IIY33_06100, partial [Erysipelotrichaceae bacterium]|nr:hypothetical protein [Erysipelotrichaceae bacterium]
TTILNISTNLFFDWYFVVYKRAGMVGTAYANLLATLVLVIIGLLFYADSGSDRCAGYQLPAVWRTGC